MIQYLPSSKKSFIAYLAIKNETRARIQIRILAKDVNKPFTIFTDRIAIIEPGMVREIKMQFPISSNYMFLEVYNEFSGIPARVNDPTFQAKITKITKIETKDVWMDADTESFVKFAEAFSERCGLLSLGDYKSADGKFLIRYMPYLTVIDQKGNEIISNTPSRIGHITGKIEVSQRHFQQYSVPMRDIVLLHEYSHKWLNPKENKKIEDESAADLNALYIYLGRGFPRTDAREVYLNIFLKSRSEENAKRYERIDEFIKRFDAK